MSAISDAGKQYKRFQEAGRNGMTPHEAYYATAGTVPFGLGSLDAVATPDGMREDIGEDVALPVALDVATMKRLEGKVVASRPLFARARAAFAKLLKV